MSEPPSVAGTPRARRTMLQQRLRFGTPQKEVPPEEEEKIPLEEQKEKKKRRNLVSDRDIMRDMISMRIPDDIKQKINQKFKERQVLDIEASGKKHIRRGNRRLQMIFALATETYEEMKIPINPVTLAENIGMVPNLISSSFTRFGSIRYRKRGEKVRTTATELIPEIAGDKMGLSDEYVAEIVKKSRQLLRASYELRESKSTRTAAAGIIAYMLDMGGARDSAGIVKRFVNLQVGTIRDIKAKVAAVDLRIAAHLQRKRRAAREKDKVSAGKRGTETKGIEEEEEIEIDSDGFSSDLTDDESDDDAADTADIRAPA